MQGLCPVERPKGLVPSIQIQVHCPPECSQLCHGLHKVARERFHHVDAFDRLSYVGQKAFTGEDVHQGERPQPFAIEELIRNEIHCPYLVSLILLYDLDTWPRYLLSP